MQLIRWEDEQLEIADNSTNDWVARENGEKAGTDHDHIQRSRLRVEARKWIMSKRLPRLPCRVRHLRALFKARAGSSPAAGS